MEKYFGNAYRGDPGVPHADPERFVNIWLGAIGFSVCTWNSPYLWQLSNQYKKVTHVILENLDIAVPLPGWHDKAMMFEHYHWKKAKAKNQPYKFKWNQYMDKELREAYYYNWPVYFP
ncbi:hypothetical protein Patl1_32160 [Pistacia atlantica]|uniref:Uncharacterized protein n=1 Tax=Pistacia atlantica TaxID=434234 RepID=A0ACC1ARV7_9ROSI|nr:hypothetical protein Patl1_32160 [Pistacia atlantica]